MARRERGPGRRRTLGTAGALACAAWLGLAAPAPVGAGENGALAAALDRSRLTVTVTGARFCLPHRHLDPTTIAIRHGDRALLPGRDFLLDPAAGCLSFPDPRLWLGAQLEVSYSHFPFDFDLRYAHRVAGVVAATAAGDSVVPRARPEPEVGSEAAGSRLRVRGNKTFAVRFGSNRDPSLDQSLDLNVSGEVASGVELRAILSDRNLPLQAQGNTETLDELDKVMLEVKSRQLSATLGDYDVQAFGGSFLTYSKRLEGVKAQGKAGEREFVLAAAVAKGQFISQELTGVEGKQGPYILTDAGGVDDIVVIAGSETVWMNGEKLTRGDNNDYTIDYGRAELTFTPRRLVTRESRITVDFEYSSEAFKRNFYVGGGRTALGGGALKLGVSMVSEADDARSPLGGGLSDAERALLAAAGDSSRAVSTSAGIYVGQGQGDYLALGDDPELRRYQYAGPRLGDYEVSFVSVGMGAGDYADSVTASGDRAYRHVGLGAGSYRPGRVVAPPAAHRLVDLTGQAKLGSAVSIESELAVSGLDLNTLSSRDDLDNAGSAKNVRLRYAPGVRVAGRELGLALAGGYRDVGTRFRTLGRIRPADYGYGWNAPAGAFERGERLRDLALEAAPARGVALGSEVAATRTGAYDGDRKAFSIRLDRRLAGRFRLERTDGRTAADSAGAADSTAAVRTDRTRDHEVGELSTVLRFLTPRLHYEREERIDRRPGSRQGLVYTRVGGGAELGLRGRARFVTDLSRRLDRDLATGRPWADLRRAFEQSYRLEVPRAGTFSLSGGFTRRTSTEVATRSRQVSDLIQVDLLHASREGGIESETHYDVTTSDISGEGQELVRVADGQGAYDELGRYVGAGGDYALRRTGAGQNDLRTRLRLSTRGEVRPRRFLGPPASLRGPLRVLAALGLETTMQVDEFTRLNLASPRLFFFPSNYQREDATFHGTFLLRQDIDVLQGNRFLAFRVRVERRDELDQRVAGVVKDVAGRSRAVRLRSSPWSPLAAELEQTWGSTVEEEAAASGGSAGAASRLDLASGTTSLDVTGRPGGDLRLGFLVRRQAERDRVAGGETRVVELVPSLTTHLGEARIDFRYRRVHETREGSFPASYRVGSTPGTRSEYDLSVDYRATEHVSVTGGVEGTRLPARKFDHTARLEVRAFF